MTYRFLCVLTLTSLLALIPAVAQTQNAPPPPVSPVVPSTQVQTPPPAPPSASNVPDYPDPRTITIGLFYWRTGQLDPDLETGRGATVNGVTTYETLTNLGKVHPTTPGIEVSVPITRTGELHFEAFLTKGTGSQTAAVTDQLFSTTINPGDFLVTQYQLKDMKLYLDDLLFPHKFPVSRLRFKSLWAIEYLSIHSNINAPYVTAGEVADGTSTIILPVFGLAAEYAISKHVLFRLDGSGFGIYHRADLWDATATLSWRASRHIEVLAGGKALHFKSSPQSSEYQIGTMDGAYAGVRWHL